MKQIVDLRPAIASKPSEPNEPIPPPVRRIVQRMNLRANYAGVSPDSDTQANYIDRCEEARAKQTVRYAIAPLQAYRRHDGKVLVAGQEVSLSDFIHQHDAPPWLQLRRLVELGIVLENYNFTGPEAA